VEIMDDKFKEHKEESMLKRLRMYAGLSQRALAEKAGVPLRQIQLFEQGQRDINKTQGATLYQLAAALGCDMEMLLR
jgi:transcriptional regulator with XRE-family HTH domain